MRAIVKLSLADKIALIYTSAGSQRKVADAIGVSHQTVGRILLAASEGRSIAQYEKRADLMHYVDAAFDLHRDLVRTVARQHQIPYSESVPIYSERLALRKRAAVFNDEAIFQGTPEEVRRYVAGKLVVRRDESGEVISAHKIKPHQLGKTKETILRGERVGAEHTHWVSDRLRNAWLVSQQRTGKFVSASVASVVNLRLYNRKADSRAAAALKSEHRYRTKEAGKYAHELREAAKTELTRKIYTGYESMSPIRPADNLISEINKKIQTRHATAISGDGTALATSIMLQLDTRPNATDNRKAPRDKRSDRGGAAQKQTRAAPRISKKKAR